MLTRRLLRELKEILAKHHLQLAAVGTGAGWVKHKLRLTDPDPAIRGANLNLIDEVLRRFSDIADFSEIVTA